MPRFTLHNYNFQKTIVIQVKSSVRRDTIVSTLEASSQQDLGAQSAIRITFCIQRLHTRVKALQLKSNCPLALCESKFCCGLADCAPFDNTAFPTTKQKESNMERFEQNCCTVYTCYTFYIWGGNTARWGGRSGSSTGQCVQLFGHNRWSSWTTGYCSSA